MPIDILVFAAIAVFLALRLKSVLGTRHDDERQRPNPFAEPERTAGTAPQAEIIPPPRPATRQITPPTGTDSAAIDGLNEIAEADAHFDPADFMNGAKAAFEMIVTAFSAGDRATLKPLLSPKLFADFDNAIAERDRAGHIAETAIHRIGKVTIKNAKLGGVMAYVTVAFVVEQTSYTRDRTGAIIDGNPDARVTVENVWTFSRDIRSSDPNWTLIETAAAEK